jgi:XRE family aerobic/anaerobic benzoate catabolism transcriptional regulator
MNDRSIARVVDDRAVRDEKREKGDRHPSLDELGARLRTLRARRGLTRKATALAAGVSEPYLANLEQGIGNPSLLILQQLATALRCTVAEVIGDVTASSPEWLLIRDALSGRPDAELRRARVAIAELFGDGGARPKAGRIALVGLRGAGKSTLGRMLGDALGVPFVELSREIERFAGCDIRQIHDLYGASAYRRYERRALEDVLETQRDAVLATPGGLVSDPATFGLLLQRTTTIWLQAAPEEHMQRVTEQGDLRPMTASPEAMDDLRQILAGRAAFYEKADFRVDTSGKSLEAALAELVAIARPIVAGER